ncbi:MAG: HAD family phosphatase [Acetobacter sp.]|uniref:HAD family hydrolase n=1 Tax=Acetobacter sp. TaxID=440 RepID=UPI0039EA5C91
MAGAVSVPGITAPRLVIFDCDGVLVDSDEPCCVICAREARKAGMDVPDDRAVQTFSGMALPLIQDLIERETRSSLGADWASTMQARFVAAMKEGVEPVPGVHAMIEAVKKLGLPMRVASNSSMEEMNVKFAATELTAHFAGRTHSARDLGIPKPKPDIYLQAARDEGVAPRDCIVLEDSDPGARAAVDAGMTCVLLRAADQPMPDWPGLIRIEKLSDFPEIIQNRLNA